MAFPTLESYRISRDLSAKLRLITLLAVTAVVFVHAYNLTSRFGSGENAAEMAARRASSASSSTSSPRR